MRKLLPLLLIITAAAACNEDKPHIAPAVGDNDSVPTMVSYGISTLISDSGVMKYRIVAERWEVNERTNPPKWIFIKGLLLQQYDKKFHVQMNIMADTAWFYSQQKLWELRGRVSLRKQDGTVFRSEELFWDQITHELYSHMYFTMVSPERELEGTDFRSNETMTRYVVNNSVGLFPMGDMTGDEQTENATPQGTIPADSTGSQEQQMPAVRSQMKAHARQGNK